MSDLELKLKKENENPVKKIGIIGMGRIGEALLTQTLQEIKKFQNLEGLFLYSKFNAPEKIIYAGDDMLINAQKSDRTDGIITQLAPLFPDIPINNFVNRVQSISELSQECDTIVVTIGRKEGEGRRREDLTGQYFKDIIEIMDGIGDRNPRILMVTNPVTPNCLIANLYSKNENPRIFGFTRLDYMRAKYILNGWLEFRDIKLRTDLYIVGPHGSGLIVTGVKIDGDKRGYDNHSLRKYFNGTPEHSLEDLSKETAEYGEKTYAIIGPEGSPSSFAAEILNSLRKMSNSNGRTKDTVALPVDIGEKCKAGLPLPITPTYVSMPVVYNNGLPSIIPSFNLEKIPVKYKTSLIRTLMNEQRRIKRYINQNYEDAFSKAATHFRL